jgi:hypothetical protein
MAIFDQFYIYLTLPDDDLIVAARNMNGFHGALNFDLERARLRARSARSR